MSESAASVKRAVSAYLRAAHGSDTVLLLLERVPVFYVLEPCVLALETSVEAIEHNTQLFPGF